MSTTTNNAAETPAVTSLGGASLTTTGRSGSRISCGWLKPSASTTCIPAGVLSRLAICSSARR